jgi:hypothetical protein
MVNIVYENYSLRLILAFFNFNFFLDHRFYYLDTILKNALLYAPFISKYVLFISIYYNLVRRAYYFRPISLLFNHRLDVFIVTMHLKKFLYSKVFRSFNTFLFLTICILGFEIFVAIQDF